MTYVPHPDGMRSAAATLEASCILQWVELHLLALSAMYIQSVDNWQVDYLSRQTLSQGDWFLLLDMFCHICQR